MFHQTQPTKLVKYSPPGFKVNAAFFSADIPVNRARVPGRANDDVENIIGITPELFTCIMKASYKYKDQLNLNGKTYNHRKPSHHNSIKGRCTR